MIKTGHPRHREGRGISISARGAIGVNSKECVKRAIEFRCPAWVPYNFDSNRTPEIEEKYGDDFLWVFAQSRPHASIPPGKPACEVNEWGVAYERLSGETMGLPKVHPLGDITRIERYAMPDLSEPARYFELAQQVRANPGKYILGMFPHFLFLHMLDLCGFENLMCAMIDQPEAVSETIERLTRSCLAVVDRMSALGVDGMIAIEDLGVQDRLIIGPAMWRRYFRPAYKAIIDRLHAHGMHFFIHSCGWIFDLIEDFIQIGVDVVQIDQQHNMGIEALSGKYRGRICFFCPCDIQTVLPCGDERQIERAVRRLLGAFATDRGGFMAKTYPQPQAIAIPEANTRLMCELFKRYGKYPLRLDERE